MIAKTRKKPSKAAKNLPAKTVTAVEAKQLAGGLNPQPLPPKILPPMKIMR